MKIAVLGTGMVGKTIASRLVELGHDVRMGSRSSLNPTAQAWSKEKGPRASYGDFSDAAAFGELAFNCTNGVTALEAMLAAGESRLAGKILADVSNALDTSVQPPGLVQCNTSSLGERLQAALPSVRVVKTLNTVNCSVMANPRQLSGPHTVFVSGNDSSAKSTVSGILIEMGWDRDEIVDLGDITTSRGPEMYLPLWLRMSGVFGSAAFNIKIVR